MDKEFPLVEERDYQKAFLGDWWSRRKLFRGPRGSGKTTLMLCEARRFQECGFNLVFLSETKAMTDLVCQYYQELFGELPLFETTEYRRVKDGTLRGRRFDAVICDEFQEIDLKSFNREVLPMSPLFIRASACKSSMGPAHYLSEQEDGDFFDSVYEK